MKPKIVALKAATFSIMFPDHQKAGMPFPNGTGFFVSTDGWFVTAAHVVKNPDGSLRDVKNAWLMKEPAGQLGLVAMCQFIELSFIDDALDIALFRVDFERNRPKEWLENLSGFPHLEVAKADIDDGDLVYSFGYPLSNTQLTQSTPGMSVGFTELCPRLTSAIISSGIDKTGMIMTNDDIKVYVLDKALNYGNSGGPIISAETGKVVAYCSRFQPVVIPQNHLKDNSGNSLQIMIPSLYGVVTRLSNRKTLEEFRSRGIPVV